MKWCPKCKQNIPDPGTSIISKYKMYWEDNKCYRCGSLLSNLAHGEVSRNVPQSSTTTSGHSHASYSKQRCRTTAAFLAMFLGGIGMHKFYLGQIGTGILYLFFCWTFIPAVIGFIEALAFFGMSDDNFHAQYG